jgi:hypothetical protein
LYTGPRAGVDPFSARGLRDALVSDISSARDRAQTVRHVIPPTENTTALMKKFFLPLLAIALTGFATAQVSAQSPTAPNSVIHVVTVAWKPGTTPEQIQAALDGVKKLPEQFKGITRVWTKSIKVQGGKANAIVMEFADEAALKAYSDSAAQKDWYKVYAPIRGESTTFDITN